MNWFSVWTAGDNADADKKEGAEMDALLWEGQSDTEPLPTPSLCLISLLERDSFPILLLLVIYNGYIFLSQRGITV